MLAKRTETNTDDRGHGMPDDVVVPYIYIGRGGARGIANKMNYVVSL